MAEPKKKRTTKKKETAEPKPKVALGPGPFDIIKRMFTDPAGIGDIPDVVLSRNAFIINERMSIAFPLQAQVFNNTRADQAQCVRCWDTFIRQRMFGRVPQFIYEKGKKKAEEATAAVAVKASEKEIREYAMHARCSVKDVRNLIDLYPEAGVKDVKDLLAYYASIDDAIQKDRDKE